MSLLIRLAILGLFFWGSQFVTNGAVLVLAFLPTLLACYWVQFTLKR